MPKRTVVADLVHEYLHAVEPLYTSREPANLKSALARLVATRSDQLADELNANQLTRKARKLAKNRDLSTSYRRACLARWKRFLSLAAPAFRHLER